MKRITALLLAVVFAFGSVSAAQADGVDIKAKGLWQFAFGVVNNASFRKSYNDSSHRYDKDDSYVKGRRKDDDNFEARQRVRTQINFISSEYLQAVLHFEIGALDWGRSQPGNVGGSAGGALDADGINIKTKRAYLDWIIPNTMVSVRMGIQGVALPAGRMGNPVFGADVAGIVVNAPIVDCLSLTGFWLRPFDESRYNTRNLRDETDVFGLVAPMTFDGVSFSPYVMYGRIGNASGFWDYVFEDIGPSNLERSSANAWWVGANLNVDILDPLVFSLDAIYGSISNTRHSVLNPSGKVKASGWYIGATLDYKLDWGTPGIFGWYASGDKSDANKDGNVKIGRLPVLGTDDGFYPTSFGTMGYYGIGNGGNDSLVSGTGAGTWGIGVQLADVTFIEDLSHTLRFAYYRGTNSASLVRDHGGEFFQYNADPLYLTTKDNVLEVNFDHVYKIYENLEVCLELGWLQLRSSRNTWGSTPDTKKTDNAWKAELNFQYSF